MSSDRAVTTHACDRIRRHLEHGAPWNACDTFREEIAKHPGDCALLYWGALAHARAGATQHAHALLDQAQAAPHQWHERLADILSLRGRLWKDAYHRAPDGAGAATMAERARREYLAAYAVQHDPFPGINAATLSMLLGERTEARRLAQEIVAQVAMQRSPRTCWDHATLGEAHLLLGRLDQARECYANAHRAAPGDAGSIATMRRQVRLLARAMPEAADVLQALAANDVVAFAGHMIDAPDRAVPRFPAALAPRVQQAIREHLVRLRQPIVYTSAACGADLIFIETALDLGAEVNVVLPFDRQDFVRTSVETGGSGWTERFDAALSKVTNVIMATEESHLGDDVLFEHAAMLLEGLTVLRASQLETTPSMLCVIDAVSEGRLGGTHASFERWRRNIGTPQKIDLAALRGPTRPDPPLHQERSEVSAVLDRPPPSGGFLVAGTPRNDNPTQATAARRERTLKTMLFADVAGFSRVHDQFAPLFQSSFLKVAAAQIEAAPVSPLIASTWGDALYVVFDSPRDAAEFALSFLASVRDTDWTAFGLADASPIRIAVHTGPVFCGFDPIMGRDTYFGSSVNKAARIEPITPPGMVYASEAFAATLAASRQHDYALEYIGRLALAKGYGESRIYRVDRP